MEKIELLKIVLLGRKISTLTHPTNSLLIQEFYQFMVIDNRNSVGCKKNNPKALILFSHEPAPNVSSKRVK